MLGEDNKIQEGQKFPSDRPPTDCQGLGSWSVPTIGEDLPHLWSDKLSPLGNLLNL